MSSSGFIRTRRDFRCPVCDGKNWCTVAEDRRVAKCMRIAEGSYRSAEDGSGTAYFHRLGNDTTATPAWRPPPTSRPPRIDALKIARRCRDAIKPEQAEAMAKELGVGVEPLDRLRMGWSSIYSAYTFPMRDATDHVIGVRVRTYDGRQWSVRGSKGGIFIPRDLTGDDLLVVCEGPTDLAALLTLGFDAIGRPNCSGGARFVESFVGEWTATRIAIIHDRDEPGSTAEQNTVRAARSLAERLAPLVKHVDTHAPPTKDIRRWVNQGATRGMITSLIEGKN